MTISAMAGGSSSDSDNRPAAAIFRSPLFNASETFVQAHAAGLRRYRPLVVGLEDKGNARPELLDRLVVASRAEALALQLGRGAALAERLRDATPALVHAHFATDGLLALPLARALGVPLVTTLHGYDVSRSRGAMLASGRWSWMRYALRRGLLMREGARFLAVSDAVRRRALAQGFPDQRTVTHYLGVDLDRFRPAPDAAEPGLVLHVGRLVEKKGTAVLIEAMAAVPEAKLVVVGDGPERERLERLARGRAAFLGALPPDEVAAWMRRAWLLAAPSITARDGDSEGLPTVIVEAAASGVPVVGTHHSGIPEAVIHGETGFLVTERDPAALASRLRELIATPRLRGDFALAARALAQARFDAARQSERLEALYDDVRAAS